MRFVSSVNFVDSSIRQFVNSRKVLMARYIGPVCRLCRREGMKLFLKGERCYTEKCAIEKRNFAPGQHGKTRKSKLAGYGVQLREKQKVKRIYGVLEDQFRRYFEQAERTRGITGETLLQLLERRLDNVAYRLGFATSRAQARQLVRHGHFTVNGRKVDIPSFSVKPGDVVSIRQSSRTNPAIVHALEEVKGRGVPEWLSFDQAAMSARVGSIPTREQINLPVQEQLIVELYSK
jgi:small subunit ribosomal protein S4